MDQAKRSLLRVLMAGLTLVTPVVSGADDDVEVVPQPKVLVEVGDDAIVDRWIFREQRPKGDGMQVVTFANGRARIDSQLKQQLEELVQGYHLSEAQQQKLKLAASGDIKTFVERVEGARKKYLILKTNELPLNPFYQEEIVPLQTQYSKGLFGEGSMFSKALRNTMTADQQAKYQDVLLERRRYLYRDWIPSSLIKVADGLRTNQIQRLQELLLEQTQPPLQYGLQDQQVILLKLSQLPSAKLKEILDKDQWKQLQPRLLEVSGTEDLIARSGAIEEPIPKSTVIIRSVRTVVNAPQADAKTD